MKQPEFQVAFRWHLGAITFWDNDFAHHYAVEDYAVEYRFMNPR